ncbi:hypothetical protein ACFVQ4_32000 [Streptomyces laurentii]|uniref:hypothetical protein n=1 Tax=Streptomyces laurentii TaxID=39478 RepID=UPI003696E221
MRRLTVATGILAVSGALVLGMTAPAHAAHGDLINRGWHATNPTGCVPVPLDNRNEFHVVNRTNEYAVVYQNTNCTGAVLEVIPPGGESSEVSAYLGRAVYIK